MLSCIVLPGTKADWVLLTKTDITLLSLVVKILKIILYIVVQQAMGRISFIILASLIFRNKVTKGRFAATYNLLLLKKYIATSFTLPFIIGQLALNFFKFYPSMPGALESHISCKASQFSFSNTGCVMLSL